MTQGSGLEGGQERRNNADFTLQGPEAGSFKIIFSYFQGHLHFICQVHRDDW